MAHLSNINPYGKKGRKALTAADFYKPHNAATPAAKALTRDAAIAWVTRLGGSVYKQQPNA